MIEFVQNYKQKPDKNNKSINHLEKSCINDIETLEKSCNFTIAFMGKSDKKSTETQKYCRRLGNCDYLCSEKRKKENTMKRKDPIEEARRYVENAKETLQEKGEFNAELNRYDDEKYVRAAGNYLWLGVLMALDAVFHVREDRRTRADIRDYKEAVGKRDRKLLALVNDGYDTMHLSMNYDGNQSKDVSDGGFRLANAIIDRCAAMVN